MFNALKMLPIIVRFFAGAVDDDEDDNEARDSTDPFLVRSGTTGLIVAVCLEVGLEFVSSSSETHSGSDSDSEESD